MYAQVLASSFLNECTKSFEHAQMPFVWLTFLWQVLDNNFNCLLDQGKTCCQNPQQDCQPVANLIPNWGQFYRTMATMHMTKLFCTFSASPALLYNLPKWEPQDCTNWHIKLMSLSKWLMTTCFSTNISQQHRKLTIMALTISQSLFFKALTAYEIIINNVVNVVINDRVECIGKHATSLQINIQFLANIHVHLWSS